ncbi:binding-protein-dependent transport systems inner membrane component [Beutenbergia cavernae DSM 12333]|uniref:Binding-protein-dependent transport systems inner membrane component n=2 Tax=Beutenbergia TaxID=84756 RepID=C5BX23_BEUC1|nr:binding-protein-dependent transport systems inner membrane component [Beutenbergia cavernae DSM 12333]
MAPGLLLFALFGLIPAVAVIGMSFTNISGMPNVPWEWTGLDNYRRFFSAGAAAANMSVIVRTIVFAFSVTVILNALALFIAIILNRRLPGAAIARSIVFMPVAFGVTVVGLVWSLMLNPTGGPAASLWEIFGARSAFLGDPRLAFPLIILVQIWAAIGTTMMIYHAGLQAVPDDLYEAATVDGANAAQRVRHVTIPMVAPSITANMIISIVGSLQTYQIIYVLTGDRPTTSVLAMQIFSLGFGSSEQGYAAAVSMVQFVLVAVVALVFLAYLRRRETQL